MSRLALVLLLLAAPSVASAQTPAGRVLDSPAARPAPPPSPPLAWEGGSPPVAAPYMPVQPPPQLAYASARAQTASLLVERLREPEPLVALSTAERATFSGVMMQAGEAPLTRDLLRTVSRLRHPDREPGWTIAGAILAIASGAGGAVTSVAYLIDSIGGADDLAYQSGLGLLGGGLLVGLTLLLVGAINNNWNPEQAEFRRRRRDVRRELRNQYRAQRRGETGWAP